MGIRFSLLILTILISGCASTAFEQAPDTAASIPHNSVFNQAAMLQRPNGSDRHPQHALPDSAEYIDLWDRIRDGFAFPELDSKHVAGYEAWYSARPEYMDRIVERARPYLFYIVEEVEKRGMPTELVLLPAIESAFVPTAYSRARAVGLWQFIPGTAKRYGMKMNWWYDGRRDVIESTRAALDYLEFLHEEFDGDWFLALAAYNAGEGKVGYEIRRNKAKGHSTDYTSLRLKKETRRYVPKLVAFAEIVRAPEEFGVSLSPIKNEPYFTAVDTGGQIDLAVARELSGSNAKELRHLNAAFKRWSTDPDGPHRLLVPVANAPALTAGLASLPASERVKWGSYTIREGDTLSQIARKYDVSVSALQQTNRIKGTMIRAGKTLLIPLSAHATVNTLPNSVGSYSVINQQGSLVHRVRQGDTLWGIARRYNVYIKQLAEWNSIRAGDTLRLGQNILVYAN